jgi:tetratricopeptide (TPR) repeat protein
VTPWLVPLARRVVGAGRRPPVVAAVAAGALVAGLPPLAYAYRLTVARSTEVAADLDTGRLVKAGRSLWVLDEIGSPRPVAGAPPRDALKALRPRVERLRRVVARPLPAGATAAERLGRAFELTQLDRLDAAAALLRPAADAGDTDAAVLLAAVDRDLGRWADCERLYRRVIDASRPQLGADAAAVARCSTAYDGLADALKAAGQPAGAGRVLLEARAVLPHRSAYYALRLGAHDLDTGRAVAALAWFEEAVRLDPALSTPAQPLIRQARLRTPACLVVP